MAGALHTGPSGAGVPYPGASLGASSHPALVLNANYRPLSYFPLSLWSWQDAVKAVFLERVEVVAEYEHTVHSPSFEMRLPSVISLKEYVRQDRSPAFTRFNLFLRDGFRCVYCGAKDELTFDHVRPRSQGGRTTWDNIVTACSPCNLKKGGMSLKQSGLHMARAPHQPSVHELQSQGRRFPPNHLHETWIDWLYWDVELEA
jgi:5-methylcytosine-specific restriction endonuclease McrA